MHANYKFKKKFLERIKKLSFDQKDFNNFLKEVKKEPKISIRCNLIKTSPELLKQRLKKKFWKVMQPWKQYPEIMIIKNKLLPGELGKSFEHMLGYYYIQELASMLPVISLNPLPHEKILDLCASPGSKTTQISAKMKNTGIVVANDNKLPRIKILAANLERCGVSNTVVTKEDAIALCHKFKKNNFFFEKILADVPCSNEGTLKSSPENAKMWNLNKIKQLSNLQKRMISSAFEILEEGGILVYSTCTHAPEENEEVINFLINKYKEAKILEPKLPKELKYRKGIVEWENKTFNKEIEKCCRLHPQDSGTEGFFIGVIKKFTNKL